MATPLDDAANEHLTLRRVVELAVLKDEHVKHQHTVSRAILRNLCRIRRE
jgi:hypothetical protein